MSPTTSEKCVVPFDIFFNPKVLKTQLRGHAAVYYAGINMIIGGVSRR